MKKLISLIFLSLIISISLNAAIVPGTKYSGIIEKFNKKSNYIVVKKMKFYFPEDKKKILENFYKMKVKVIFTYINKNGKRYIVFVKENREIGGRM